VPKPVAQPDKAAAAAGPTSASRTDPSFAQAATGAGEAGEVERQRLRDIVRAGYLARLQAAIARHKYYPRLSRRRGEEGRVLLRLVIGSDGDFSEVRVARSSGKRRLDAAALKTIERLGHAEPLPPELGLSAWRISVPMVFSLK
jgi:protein TonB